MLDKIKGMRHFLWDFWIKGKMHTGNKRCLENGRGWDILIPERGLSTDHFRNISETISETF